MVNPCFSFHREMFQSFLGGIKNIWLVKVKNSIISILKTEEWGIWAGSKEDRGRGGRRVCEIAF